MQHQEKGKASKNVLDLVSSCLEVFWSLAQCRHGVKISFSGSSEYELNVCVTIATSKVMTRSSSWEMLDFRSVLIYLKSCQGIFVLSNTLCRTEAYRHKRSSSVLTFCIHALRMWSIRKTNAASLQNEASAEVPKSPFTSMLKCMTLQQK